MNRHPLLAGAWAKVDRAQEHLKTSNEEWTEIVSRNRQRILGPIEVNPQTGWEVLKIGDFDPDLTRFAVIGGEIAYALRSALEHVVWALVRANHKKPRDSNRFPVVKRPMSPQDFTRQTKNDALLGVRRATIDLIETYQPYHAPDPDAHWLSVLNEFANVDKHRTIYAAYAAAADPTAIRAALRMEPAPERIEFRVLFKRGQRLKPGAKLARFRGIPIDPHRKVRVDGKFPLNVDLRERHGAAEPRGDFRNWLSEVASIVETVERDFFPKRAHRAAS